MVSIGKNLSFVPKKVEQTAKLVGLKGSELERKAVADEFCTKFSDVILGIFDRKEEQGMKAVITKGEIKYVIKKLFPNANINVKSCKDKESFGMVVRYLNSDGAVQSYDIKLRFKGFGQSAYIEKGDSKSLNTMSHEFRHYVNFMTEPKYNARLDVKGLSATKKNQAWDFYDKYLYADESKHINEKDAARIKSMETKLRAFFGFKEFSQAEKINQLQAWRHHLKTEMMAFKDGYSPDALGNKTFFLKSVKKFKDGKDVKFDYTDVFGNNKAVDTKKLSDVAEKTTELKTALEEESKMYYSTWVEKNYFMPEKTKIIEKMLADEIRSIREEQKILYGKPEVKTNDSPKGFKLVNFWKKKD